MRVILAQVPSTDRRTGLLVGTLATFFALDAAFLGSVAGIGFAPVALAQAVVEVLPGAITVPLIELLQFWAERLLIAGVIVAFFAAGALAGAFAADARRRDGVVIALAAGPWAAAVVLAQLFARAKVDLPSNVLDAAIGAIVQLATLAFLVPATLRTREEVASPSRRRALLGVAGLAGLAAVGSLLGGSLLRIGNAVGDMPATARRLVKRAAPTAADERLDRLAGATARVTSNADHYIVDSALIKPHVDIAEWRLDVKGAVDQPYSLTFDQLLDLDAVEQLHTLECISNTVGGDLVSTALWTGVPLRDLLMRARPRSDAFDVVLRSVDDYTDSFPLAKALEPETLVAYLMNGNTIPQGHGYPARALIPNIYGMKNVKWLRSIELVTYDFRGYWQERGWSDIATVNTNARIDVPGRALRWSGGPTDIAGIAFAGARGISKVEVSTDGGGSWSQADVEQPLAPLTWVRWLYRWTPSGSGPFRVVVRATDGHGDLQTSVGREPFPNGATGLHAVDVVVQRA